MRGLMLFILLPLAACEFEPPGLEQSEGEAFFKIRTVQLNCTGSVDECKDDSLDDVTAITFYTEEDCNNIVDSTPTVATGSSPLTCDSNSCNTEINEFSKGGAPVESLSQGSYTLVSFIDLNANSLPDLDEPYFCAHEVQISASKNNALVNVVLVRLRSEVD